MKDLFKPGRNLDEYLEDDGTLKKNCITCMNRSTSVTWGSYLCNGGMDRYMECQEVEKGQLATRLSRKTAAFKYKFWEPRVDVNSFITEEDMDI